MAGSTFQPPTHLDPAQDSTQQLAFINQNFQSLANSLNPLIVSDGTTNRIILGKQNDGTYGLRVSKAGVDVGSATNSQLIFNSDQNIFKIVLSGSTSSSIPTPFTTGSTVVASVPHGMSTKPAFVAFVDIPTGDGSSPIQGKLNSVPVSIVVPTGAFAGLTTVQVTGDVDTTNLNLRISNTSGVNLTGVNGTWTFKYYILQETAN